MRLRTNIVIIVVVVILAGIVGIPAISSAQAMDVEEGDLIRAIGDFDVWIVKYPSTGSGQVAKKFRRLILNPDVFNMYGHLRWGDVKDVDQSIVDFFTESTLVRAEGDTKVYKLYPAGDTGEKRWIETADIFNTWGFDWDAVYTINDFDRDSYVTGLPLESESTVEDKTADWKIYRNEKYGFEVRYPPIYRLGLIVAVNEDPEEQAKVKVLNQGLPPFKGVPEEDELNIQTVRYNSLPEEMREIKLKLDNSLIDDKIGGYTVIEISGIKTLRGLYFSPHWGGYDSAARFFNNNGDMIELSTYLKSKSKEQAEKEERNAIFDQILSTFKFIPEEMLAPVAPVLEDPGTTISSGNTFNITWSAPSGATSYILQLDTNSFFTNPTEVYAGNSTSYFQTLTPETTITYYWRVQARNNIGSSPWSNVVDMGVIVPSEEKSITVTSPNGGKKWVRGETYDITWKSTGVDKIDIHIINYSYSSEAPRIIATDISAIQGSYSWTIPGDIFKQSWYPRDCYRIRILEKKPDDLFGVQDISDNCFEIVQPSITLTSPNGGEEWIVGETHRITWDSIGIRKIRINIYKGSQLLKTVSLTTNPGFYDWTVDSNFTAGSDYKVWITGYCYYDYLYPGNSDFFSIVFPSITVTSPNGGEEWVRGNTYEIKWDSAGVEKVDISVLNLADSPRGQGVTGIDAGLGRYSFNVSESPQGLIGLPAGEKYKVFIRGEAQDGTRIEDWSDDYFSIEEVCPLPTAPVLTDPGESVLVGATFQLAWAAIPGAASYTLEISPNNTFPPASTSSYDLGAVTSYNTYVEGATTYYYRLKATNACGDGAWSNVVDMEITGQVNTYTTDTQLYPAIAMDSDGNFVIAWESFQQDGDSWGIFAQRYNPQGISQGSEFQVNAFTSSYQHHPAVAMDSDGDFVITWESYTQDGDHYGIFAQRYNSLGQPQGPEFQVNTYTPSAQCKPAIAMDSDGDFVIVWHSYYQDGSKYGVYAQRYNSSGQPQDSEFQVNTYTADYQESPAVAMDSDGDFVITWESREQDGSDRGIFAQKYNSSGAALGSEFQVNTSYTSGYQWKSAVAMDSDGDFVITWQSRNQDGSDSGIFAQKYNSSGAALGSEFQVNTYTADYQESPAIAMDSDGDFVVAWESYGQDGSQDGIYAQKYNSQGISQGSEFQVNTYTPGHQRESAIAMDSDGDFIIAWMSEDQDGDGYGIFARKY